MIGRFKFKCSHCGFVFHEGWDAYVYVTDDSGKRILCPVPYPESEVSRVLGKDASPELIAERIGFSTFCLCLDCLTVCELDMGQEEASTARKEKGRPPSSSTLPGFYEILLGSRREGDEKRCPQCRSRRIKTIWEMTGEPCPKCKEGMIEPWRVGGWL